MLVSEVVSSYWTHYRLATSKSREDRLAAGEWFWSWEAVDDAVRSLDPELITLLVDLAAAVEDDEAALSYLGAGPLEDLISHNGPDFARALLEDLEKAARTSKNFRRALGSVIWPNEPSTVVDRLKPLTT